MTPRPHRLIDGDALNRRVMEELFLWAAKSLSSIRESNIGNEQFGRENFGDYSISEMRFAVQHSLQYWVPAHGHLLAASLLIVDDVSGYCEGIVEWSVKLQYGDSAKYIVAWPVINGSVLVEGHDANDTDQLIQYTHPGAGNPAVNPASATEASASDLRADSYGTLGGTASFSGELHRSSLAIAMFGVGTFKVLDAAIGHRKVVR